MSQNKNIVLSDKPGPDFRNPSGKGVKKPGFVKRYPVLTTLLLGLLGMAVIYFWKNYELKKERAHIIELASERLQEKDQDMLRLLSRPMVWSVRSELMRNNVEQINIFLGDLVREKSIHFIHVINPEGTIIISTDKNLEGKGVGVVIDRSFLRAETTRIMTRDDDTYVVIAPVMGFDKRLGSLIFSYEKDEFDPEK